MFGAVKRRVKSSYRYMLIFAKWLLIASITGAVGGLVGTCFHKSIEYVTQVRMENSWVIFLLPLGGLLIAAIYRLCGMSDNTGTDQIISSIRSGENVRIVMAPLIFVGTVLTHLFGGSAGREGAALQLGGSIGIQIGKVINLNQKDMSLATICGMSSVFAALFGTPLTATFFAMEVISVGVIYYSGFIPCIVSSLVAYKISTLLGVEPIHYALQVIPEVSFFVVVKVGILAALCAVVSILFCLALKAVRQLMDRKLKNDYIRILIGAALIIGLTLIVQNHDYNGTGMDVIERALYGNARIEAFALKILFTAITLAAGFKGGEIIPTFFIGATFGCIMGSVLGLDSGFCAAIGLIALFCGVVNCPVASIILSVELFGSGGLLLFAIACSVSYMLSGYYGLYKSQRIVYSKTKPKFINFNVK